MSEFNRVDSCRNCCDTLDVLTTCMMCEQPAQFKCSNCYHFVDDPIHTNCVILEDNVQFTPKNRLISKIYQIMDKKYSDFLYTWILGESRAK